MEVLTQHVNATPVPPSRVAEQPIFRGLDEVIMKCLEKDPANRPADAETLSTLLEKSVVGARWTQESARRWWEVHDRKK
jgi:serine/threonine-protein kinase